jgi:hypothetical protein
MTTTLPEPILEPTRTEPTTKDLLNRAADILEEFDWCQGQTGSRRIEAMCMAGAISEAALDLGANGLTMRTSCQSLHALIGTGFVSWNDEPGRTKAQVVAKLREAANQ